MDKKKLMAVAEKMEELAGSIKELCSDAEEEKTAEPEKKEEKAAEPAPKEEEKTVEYTREDVRKALAAKSTAGFTVQVRELLNKHGATKLSAIAESEYAAIMREVEEIG